MASASVEVSVISMPETALNVLVGSSATMIPPTRAVRLDSVNLRRMR